MLDLYVIYTYFTQEKALNFLFIYFLELFRHQNNAVNNSTFFFNMYIYIYVSRFGNLAAMSSCCWRHAGYKSYVVINYPLIKRRLHGVSETIQCVALLERHALARNNAIIAVNKANLVQITTIS